MKLEQIAVTADNHLGPCRNSCCDDMIIVAIVGNYSRDIAWFHNDCQFTIIRQCLFDG